MGPGTCSTEGGPTVAHSDPSSLPQFSRRQWGPGTCSAEKDLFYAYTDTTHKGKSEIDGWYRGEAKPIWQHNTKNKGEEERRYKTNIMFVRADNLTGRCMHCVQ